MPSPLNTPYLSLQFLHPGLGSLEGVSVGDIVDHDGGLGAAVVHRGEAVVALLARRVPDLELQTHLGFDCVLLAVAVNETHLDGCIVQTYCLSQKCSSDGALNGITLRDQFMLDFSLPLGIHETVP